jgi:hypothetical protein
MNRVIDRAWSRGAESRKRETSLNILKTLLNKKIKKTALKYKPRL